MHKATSKANVPGLRNKKAPIKGPVHVLSQLETVAGDGKFQAIVLVVSWAVLVTVAIYISSKSSLSHLSTGDQYDSTYPLISWKLGTYLTFYTQHTNLIKLPFLWIQAKLSPYGMVSYVSMNVALVVATVAGWSLLLARIVKRPFARSSVNFILAGLLLASYDFSVNLVMPTIRNIEYPIFLGYVLLVQNYIQTARVSRLIWGSILLALLVASDHFFLYVAPLSVLLGAGLLYRRGYIDKGQTTKSACSSLAGALGGVFLLKLLVHLGVLHLLPVSDSVLSYNQLWGQISNCIEQILRMFGGDFFGLSIGTHILARIGLALIAGASFWIVYRTLKGDSRGEQGISKNPLLLRYVMAGLAVVTVAAYIFSGYATPFMENIRYLTILPFIGVLLLALEYEYADRMLLLVSAGVLLAGIACLPVTNSSLRYDRQQSSQWVSLDRAIIAYLHRHKVSVGYGTLGYASTTWFFSHQKINIYTIRPCNFKNPVLSASAWYSIAYRGRTALLVDRSIGAAWTDESWHVCSPEQLTKIYGKPIAEKVIGLRQGKPVEVLIYNYNIGTRLQ